MGKHGMLLNFAFKIVNTSFYKEINSVFIPKLHEEKKLIDLENQ